MKKTLAVMEVLTLCQCGGSVKLLPRYVADGKRKRYHLALLSLEMAIDKIAIITSAQTESGLTKENVRTWCVEIFGGVASASSGNNLSVCAF